MSSLLPTRTTASTRSLWRRLFHPRDLEGYGRDRLLQDLSAASAVTFLAVPQGVAYAMIAELPPAMGLYCAFLPVIIGSFFRSSPYVVTGPTNALSLLVGAAAIAQLESDPVQLALALAMMVGLMQLAAGFLRLGSLVDYISKPVLMGYITGAGLLIGVGQLPNATRSPGGRGSIFEKIAGWAEALPQLHLPSLLLTLGTVVLLLLIRAWSRKLPGATLVMVLATGLSFLLSAESAGIQTVGSLAPIPEGLPSLQLPDLTGWQSLIPLALACTMLSLVETSAVARSIASRRGQRVEISKEFIGEGLANVTAAICMGYPTAGSLSRSSLNDQAQASSRLSGIFSGIFMGLVLLFMGPLMNYTPIPCLAGILLLVAWDLVDVQQLRKVLRSHSGDALAFGVTLAGTWILHLDKAIYLGVAMSLIMFLRQERLLSVREVVIDGRGRLREVGVKRTEDESAPSLHRCSSIHLLNLDGPMFFGASTELESALKRARREHDCKVLILRLKRTENLDFTTSQTLVRAAWNMREEGRHLLLVGMQEAAMKILEGTGAVEDIGAENLFPTQERLFAALEDAIQRGLDLVEAHRCDRADSDGEGSCPLRGWIQMRNPM